jgi:hypothetical protein
LNTAQSARAELAELLLDGRRKRNQPVPPSQLGSALGQNTHERSEICNDYRLLIAAATLFDGFAEIKIKIRFPEGMLRARGDAIDRIEILTPSRGTTHGDAKTAGCYLGKGPL